MQKHYDRDNLFFSFPDSWTLDGENATDSTESVSVLSPDGGFWCVRCEDHETTTEQVLTQALDAMREEYPEMEVEQASETIEGEHLTGADMHFFCFDLTGTASVRVWETDGRKLVIFTQAEDNQFERLQPIFAAITASLIRGK